MDDKDKPPIFTDPAERLDWIMNWVRRTGKTWHEPGFTLRPSRPKEKDWGCLFWGIGIPLAIFLRPILEFLGVIK